MGRTHRGRRSEYGMERWLVRRLAFKDPNNGDVVARETLGLKFFTEGEVLVSPRHDGSLQKDLPLPEETADVKMPTVKRISDEVF